MKFTLNAKLLSLVLALFMLAAALTACVGATAQAQNKSEVADNGTSGGRLQDNPLFGWLKNGFGKQEFTTTKAADREVAETTAYLPETDNIYIGFYGEQASGAPASGVPARLVAMFGMNTYYVADGALYYYTYNADEPDASTHEKVTDIDFDVYKIYLYGEKAVVFYSIYGKVVHVIIAYGASLFDYDYRYSNSELAEYENLYLANNPTKPSNPNPDVATPDYTGPYTSAPQSGDYPEGSTWYYTGETTPPSEYDDSVQIAIYNCPYFIYQRHFLPISINYGYYVIQGHGADDGLYRVDFDPNDNYVTDPGQFKTKHTKICALPTEVNKIDYDKNGNIYAVNYSYDSKIAYIIDTKTGEITYLT